MAQNTNYLFIRVYNLEGKKIGNDLLANITDTTVSLEVKDSIVSIPLSEIGEIRTKHSVAGNMVIGTIIGTSLGFSLILGDFETSTSSNFTGPERLMAMVGGAILGTVGGLIAVIFRKSERYEIIGNADALKKFKDSVLIPLPG